VSYPIIPLAELIQYACENGHDRFTGLISLYLHLLANTPRDNNNTVRTASPVIVRQPTPQVVAAWTFAPRVNALTRSRVRARRTYRKASQEGLGVKRRVLGGGLDIYEGDNDGGAR
jgi:hypothetical protein